MTPTMFEISYQKQKTPLKSYLPCKNVNFESPLLSLLEEDIGFSRGVENKAPSTTCSHFSGDSHIYRPLHVDWYVGRFPL